MQILSFLVHSSAEFAKNRFFKALFPTQMSLVCQLPVLHSDYLTQMPSFLAVRLLHTYAHYHPNMGSKWWYCRFQNVPILPENVLLKLYF